MGDRVRLLNTTRWFEGPSNPIWDGTQGKVLGTVFAVGSAVHVNWDNGGTNAYDNADSDLALGSPNTDEDAFAKMADDFYRGLS